jgi:hypothetical protein
MGVYTDALEVSINAVPKLFVGLATKEDRKLRK